MEAKTEPEEVVHQQDIGNSGTIETDEHYSEIIQKNINPEEMDTAGNTGCEDSKEQAQEAPQAVNNAVQSSESVEINDKIKNSLCIIANKTGNSIAEEKTKYTRRANPLKRKRSRPIKRKRKKHVNIIIHSLIQEDPKAHDIETVVGNDASIDTENTSVDTSSQDMEYCLTVSNLPNNWSFMEIKNYIDTECGPVDEIEMIKDDKTGIGSIRLSYQTEDECKEAMQKLQDKEVSGNKLTLEMAAVPLEMNSDSDTDTTETHKKPWRPDLDSWEVDAQGTYGLKLQYLKSLGLTPPLDKWIYVTNFRCDKSELRDVMELAGNVLMCSIVLNPQRYANVMYSHPLEAVQAVSMLHNQILYGMPLKVKMNRSTVNTILLPKGLSHIGQGLGLNGKPLRSIVKHYERFVENKDCSLNLAMFDIPDNHLMKLNEEFDGKFEVKSVEDINYPRSLDTAEKNDTTAPKTEITPRKIESPKPAIIQTPAFTISQPQPVSPVRANFTPPAPQQNFQQRSFAPNFRPQFNQMMNGQMQGPQGPSGPGPMGLIGTGPMGPTGPGPMCPTGPGFMGPIGSGPMGPSGPGPMGPIGPGPIGPAGPGPMGPIGPGSIEPLMQRPGPQPLFAQPFTVPQPGPMGPTWNQGPGPVRGPAFPNEPVKLMLGNLPPSTTFGLLCEKMSEWGHVVCIQLTTPGCAVVTFANRMQADACFQHFHGRNIENHIIQMKYA